MFNAAKLGTDTEVNFGDKSFLVIDDFQGMRAVLRDILRACGANARSIVTASNGVEAVAILERNKFDVVLCDYNLGAGKNGQQVLEEARHRKLISPACAWVIITAEKTTDIVTGAAENQPDAYLLKPVTESMLRQRLQKVWTKKEAFAEIDAAIGRKDFRKAIQLCEDRMAHDKLNAVELLRIRAQLLLDSGDHAKARQVLEEALAEREFPWAKVGLAKILHHEQDYSMAKALLESVTMENRTYVEAYDWLARCHEALGEHEEASRVLEQATRISPHSVARQKSLGELSLKLGNLAVAEKAFKKSVSLGEHSIFRTPDAYLGLAKTYSASDNPNEALQVLDSVAKKFSDASVKAKALAVTGMVYHRSGDPIQARKVARELAQQMERSPRLDESASALEAAELFLLTGEKEKAIDLLQDQVRNDPDNKALVGQIQEMFTAANMGDEGANLVEQSRKEAVTRMNEGVLLAREGKLDEAIASLREARRVMPSNVRVMFNLAHVMISRMQRNGAQPSVTGEIRELLLEANRLAPRDARFSQLMEALSAASGS